ncbi:hypothetical protein NQ314_000613, partial [Rhamnusium bicolor]
MDNEDFLMFYLLYLSYLYVCHVNLSQARRRRWWVRDIYLNRDEAGYFNKMFKNMKEKDPEEFFKHTRMDRHIYDLLLSQTKDHLTKKSIRTPINFECRLVVTLTLYCPVNYVDGEDTDGMVHLGEWRNETDPLRQARFGSNNSTRNAFHLRESLTSYFLAEGAVPF